MDRIHRFTLEAILFLAVAFTGSSNGAAENLTSKHNLSEISRRLELLNKPAVKSIQSEDGDIIDCVDIYKQPSLDHPALRNHVIQMKPKLRTNISKQAEHSSTYNISQIWTRSGSCPKGTVPIRRIRKSDLLRAHSLYRFGRKHPTVARKLTRKKNFYANRANSSSPLKQITDMNFSEMNHSTAIILAQGFSYSGAKGDLNVWNPAVEFDDEYSSGQIWLRNGPWYDFESIESGWIVNPGLYGDRRTRLFVYWTSDSSKNTGCFDLTCSGFVQTSDTIALGSVIDPVSYPGIYQQYQITLYIYKDFDTNNWWLQYGDNIDIGYWPGELFGELNHQATVVKWGGQVYSTRIGKPRHTATDMGSGSTFLRYGYGCYVRQIRIRDNSLLLKYPQFVETWTDEYNCYRSFNKWEYMTEPEFYYGGPGRNPTCP